MRIIRLLFGVFFLANVLSCAAYAQTDWQSSEYGEPVTIEGTVSRDPIGLKIKLSDKSIYDLLSGRRQTQEDLDHLESGDHVIGLGRLLVSKKQIYLDDLEMVGIKKSSVNGAKLTKKRFLSFTTLRTSL
jgi:hypothetical protein